MAGSNEELRAHVLGAIARGWCAPKNSHKVVDPDLAEAMADEVIAALAPAQEPAGDFHDTLYAAKIKLILDPSDDASGEVAAEIGMTTGPDDDLTIYLHAVSDGNPLRLTVATPTPQAADYAVFDPIQWDGMLVLANGCELPLRKREDGKLEIDPRHAQDGTAAGAAPEGWQPIETAPMDGTPILAWSIEFGARETYWRLFGEGSPAKAMHARGEGPSGAWDWSEPMSSWGASWKPTHWQPLPAAPQPGAQEQSA